MTLADRVKALRGEVRGHKAAIRQHRAALAVTAAQLEALEKECRERGVRLIIKGEEGEISWPTSVHPSSTSTL